MTNLFDEQNRGERAAAILRDPLVVEAFETLKNTYVSRWLDSDLKDIDLREVAFYRVRALKDLEDHFRSLVQTGAMASRQLENPRK